MKNALDMSSDTHDPAPRLSPQDEAALDVLMQARTRQGLKLASTDPQRQAAVEQVLGLIDRWPACEPPPGLADRTLALVTRISRSLTPGLDDRAALTEAGAPPSGLPWQWSEILASAASVALALTLLWPALNFTRDSSRRVACASNLAAAGSAMEHYAADFAGVLPRRRTAPGAPWWNVGRSDTGENQVVTSNPANLYLLANGRYLRSDTLNCPQNPHAPKGLSPDAHDWPEPRAVSFSYQNQYSAKPLRPRDLPELAILADRNPLFDIRDNLAAFKQRPDLDGNSPSFTHRRAGQNVLLASGVVRWTTEPTMRTAQTNDNIWLLSGVENYQGNEAPQGQRDAFLVP